MRLKEQTSAGFTLVEIMIVVAIIGLLAVIAVPNYVRSRAAAQKSHCINNLRQIDGAINQQALERKLSGNTPVYEADITPYLKQGSDTSCSAGGTMFSDSYEVVDCQTLPKCKKNGTEHVLE